MAKRDPTQQYLDTLLLYYEEEIIGEAYFRAFAEQLPEPAHAHKTHLMADVERHAANAVVPLLHRYNLTSRSDKEMQALGCAQALETLTDWDSALDEMRRTFPGYITDFERLEAMAPDADLPALQFLTEHERAATAFLDLELSDPDASAQPLIVFLHSPAPAIARKGQT